jgi:hypothetical protein
MSYANRGSPALYSDVSIAAVGVGVPASSYGALILAVSASWRVESRGSSSVYSEPCVGVGAIGVATLDVGSPAPCCMASRGWVVSKSTNKLTIMYPPKTQPRGWQAVTVPRFLPFPCVVFQALTLGWARKYRWFCEPVDYSHTLEAYTVSKGSNVTGIHCSRLKWHFIIPLLFSRKVLYQN